MQNWECSDIIKAELLSADALPKPSPGGEGGRRSLTDEVERPPSRSAHSPNKYPAPMPSTAEMQMIRMGCFFIFKSRYSPSAKITSDT